MSNIPLGALSPVSWPSMASFHFAIPLEVNPELSRSPSKIVKSALSATAWSDRAERSDVADFVSAQEMNLKEGAAWACFWSMTISIASRHRIRISPMIWALRVIADFVFIVHFLVFCETLIHAYE